MSKAYEDKGYFRRQYPRRAMKRKIGVLCDGTYFMCESGEIGEGGMSISTEYVLTEGHELVVSFQVPGGDFVFLRGIVRSTQKKEGDRVTHGLSFNSIEFAIKRQIRAFVSARTESELI
ncbi:PilZ domain-containing protein [Bdellovibrio sp. 22V]|uniref:PilZ domain-containing protein n=1 Tax=Bdellovibrio TaxID=958 RepID=UPI0025438322|nr:PilZ domain-containing protein [Bdellovibrio sp. 22V]WII72050.1 PilZ domain-containing protein [Bdellovibrio sp. 22V]